MNDAPSSPPFERVVRTIEHAAALDRWSERIRPVAQRLVGNGAARDVATGRWLGHPVHPAGVIVPMSAWFGGLLVDAVGGRSGAGIARRLTGIGVLTAVPVAWTGAADWVDTDGAEQRVGTAHAVLNNVAIAMFTASWWVRRSGRRRAGVLLGLVGASATGLAASLGGHLSYRRGVGVDTTAFQSGPQEWTPIDRDAGTAADAAVDEPAPGRVERAVVGDVTLAVVGRADSEPAVLESRCTHRGGPLHEGPVVDGCLECPWHGSRFDLDSGAVRTGPATAPQPAYSVRRSGGRLEVRRRELGALRAHSV